MPQRQTSVTNRPQGRLARPCGDEADRDRHVVQACADLPGELWAAGT